MLCLRNETIQRLLVILLHNIDGVIGLIGPFKTANPLVLALRENLELIEEGDLSRLMITFPLPSWAWK